MIEASRCRELYTEALKGDAQWQALETSPGALFTYDDASTYIQPPPFLEGAPLKLPEEGGDGTKVIEGIRCMLLLGDSVTTDHIRCVPHDHHPVHLENAGWARCDTVTALQHHPAQLDPTATHLECPLKTSGLLIPICADMQFMLTCRHTRVPTLCHTNMKAPSPASRPLRTVANTLSRTV